MEIDTLSLFYHIMNAQKSQANMHFLKKSVTLQKESARTRNRGRKNNELRLVLSLDSRKDFLYFSFGHCYLFLPIGIEYAIM